MQRLNFIEERIAKKPEDFLYSVPIGPAKKGETPIYRKVSHKDKLPNVPSNIESLGDVWENRVKKFGQNKLL